MQLKYQDDKVQRVLCDPRILQKKVGLEIGRKNKAKTKPIRGNREFQSIFNKSWIRQATSTGRKFR